MNANLSLLNAVAPRLLTMSLTVGAAARLWAGPGLDLIEVGRWPDPPAAGEDNAPRHVVVSGDYAYCAMGDAGLIVLDISDVTRPRQVGACPTLGYADHFWMSGDYGYVRTPGQHGEIDLQVIDIRSPGNPQPLGGVTLAPPASFWVSDIAFSVSYGYVAAGNLKGGHLFVLDVRNPASPRVVGDYAPVAQNEVSAVAISGDHAFVVAGGGLEVLDLSDPANPRRIAGYQPSTPASDIAVSGNLAYLGVAAPGILEIVDIGEPKIPQQFATVPKVRRSPLLDARRQVSVAGGYACVQVGFFSEDGPGMLYIVDVAEPKHPRVVGLYPSEHVTVKPPYAFVTQWLAGIRILDLRHPANPQIVATHPVPNVGAMATAGRLAFIVTEDTSLEVVDLGDPAQPQRVGRYDTTGSVFSLILSGNYAFVSVSGQGLLILDIEDPGQPKRIGAYQPPHQASVNPIGIVNQHAIVRESWWVSPSNNWEGLAVVDVRDPTNPRRITEIKGEFGMVALSGSQLLTLNSGSSVDRGSLAVFDVSDLLNPRLTGTYQETTNWYGQAVAVIGSLAYVASLRSDALSGRPRPELQVFDLADPAQPRLLGWVERRHRSGGQLVVSGRYAYVTDGYYGLEVFDVGDPAHPRRVGGNSAVVGGAFALAEGRLVVTGGNRLAILNPFVPLQVGPVSWAQSRLNLSLSGPPDWPVRVQRSTDLTTWQDWQTVTLGNAAVELTDPDATSQPRRFYRAVAP